MSSGGCHHSRVRQGHRAGPWANGGAAKADPRALTQASANALREGNTLQRFLALCRVKDG